MPVSGKRMVGVQTKRCPVLFREHVWGLCEEMGLKIQSDYNNLTNQVNHSEFNSSSKRKLLMKSKNIRVVLLSVHLGVV